MNSLILLCNEDFPRCGMCLRFQDGAGGGRVVDCRGCRTIQFCPNYDHVGLTLALIAAARRDRGPAAAALFLVPAA